jgi:4-aminobutyrate aminotransferase
MPGGSLSQRDAAVIANIGRLRFSPLAVVGGAGSRVIDEDGRSLLDLSASWGAASLGYAHPAVVEAVNRAVARMAGASLLSYPNEEAVALAEELLAVTPGSGERRVWFGHSGSDANDCVLRAVQAATGRPRIISFIGSYHGNLTGSMSVSGHTAMTHTLPRAGLVLLPYPDPYRGEFSADDVLNLLDYQLATTCPPTQVAAVFLEPLMSDGGLIVPPTGFLTALQARCRRHGIQVIVDEVKVGLGRSGALHCFALEGLEPDIVVLGKGLGGGLPLSAVIGPRAILDHAPAFALQTTAGNPVAAAAGRAVLHTVAADHLVDRAATLGAAFAQRLRVLSESQPLIGDVRGRGLAVGVELVEDRATRAPVPRVTTAKVVLRAYQLGAVFFYVGLRGNVLEFTPPLTTSAAELSEGVAILDQALTDVTHGVVADAEVAPYMMW